MAPPAERFARVGKQMATTTAHLPALAAARKLYQLTEQEKSRMWVRAADGKLKIKRSMSFSKFEEHSWSMPVGASLFRSFLRTQPVSTLHSALGGHMWPTTAMDTAA